MKRPFFIVLLLGLLFSLQPLWACDLCSIYSSNHATAQSGQGFYLGAAEQYSPFGTLQQDGHKVPNPTGQYMNSSISQMFLGYNVNSRVGVQLTVPVIYRTFRRPVGNAIQQGSVGGFGDSSIVAKVNALQKLSEDFNFNWGFVGGIKLPTGSSSRLREELFETEDEGGEESGVHGHDLTLGSGSFDGIVGSNLNLRWHRFLFSGDVQYAIRSRGSFGYRFANDLHWNAAMGGYLLLNHTLTLALQGQTAGETKGLDNLNGVPSTDTGITSVYLGPRVLFTYKEHLSFTAAGDIPILQNNTALQTVPDYRVRSAVTWAF